MGNIPGKILLFRGVLNKEKTCLDLQRRNAMAFPYIMSGCFVKGHAKAWPQVSQDLKILLDRHLF
jgi:hypothetical protein